MPKNASHKKAIRDRMAATGEPYMEARRHVEASSHPQAETTSGAWVIQQSPIDRTDSKPYEWVLHADRSTYGFIDHGHLLGFVRDPNDRTNVEILRPPLNEDDVRSMVGGYPITMDRFTMGWSTWDHPIESFEAALPADERTHLYGGTQRERNGSVDSDRAALRALADQRRNAPQTRVFVSGLALTDGTVIDVEPGGAQRGADPGGDAAAKGHPQQGPAGQLRQVHRGRLPGQRVALGHRQDAGQRAQPVDSKVAVQQRRARGTQPHRARDHVGLDLVGRLDPDGQPLAVVSPGARQQAERQRRDGGDTNRGHPFARHLARAVPQF